MKRRNVVENRFSGLLGQAKLTTKRMKPEAIRDILRDMFPEAFETFKEPEPPELFRFTYRNVRFSIRPETKEHGNIYWHMRKYASGTHHNVYLAPAGSLTLELLENAAELILSRMESK